MDKRGYGGKTLNDPKVIKKDKYINSEEKVAVVQGVTLYEAEHKHEFIELAYVEEGEAQHWVNGETFQLSAGDIMMLDSGVSHCYLATTPTISVWNIIFLPEFFDFFLKEGDRCIEYACRTMLKEDVGSALMKESGFLSLPKEQAKSVVPYIRQIIEEKKEERPGYLEAIHSLLKLAIIEIFRRGHDAKGDFSDKQKRIYREMMEYIKKNKGDGVSASYLSKLLFYSPEYLSKTFNNISGKSLKKYIQKEKLEKAKRELLSTDKTVEEIMEEAGYNDKKYFYEIFKREYGVSPGKYRKG